jgi:hypothetical protein
MKDIQLVKTPQVNAVISHYLSEKDKAIAELDVVLNRPVGVGGHNTLVEDTLEIFEKLEKASNMIEFLSKVVVDKQVNLN